MCLAELITKSIFMQLGFRDPESHPAWNKCVASVQSHIDNNVNAMRDVAIADAVRSMQQKPWWKLWRFDK